MKTLTLSLMLLASAPFAGAAHAAVSSCAGMPDGTPCADGDACTTDDRCRGETCYAGADICTDGGVPQPLPQTVTIPAGCVPPDEPDGGVNAKSRVAGGGGCSVAGHAAGGGLGVLVVAAIALGALVSRRKKLALALLLASGCASTAKAERPKDGRVALCQRACDRVLDSMATSFLDGDTCRCFAPDSSWERHPVSAELTLLSRPDGIAHAQR